jgi:pimeloyl-ACP methyl ester carboxylesterase
LALMDHLGIERFCVMGMCIGGAFVLELAREAPDRVAAGVAMQPIGLDGNRDEFRTIFEDWRGTIGEEHPEASDDDWEGCWTNLFGGDDTLWSVPDAVLPTITTPLLVLQGADVYHPTLASRRVAELVPGATLVEQWKQPDDQPAARAAVDAFLAEHAR